MKKNKNLAAFCILLSTCSLLFCEELQTTPQPLVSQECPNAFDPSTQKNEPLTEQPLKKVVATNLIVAEFKMRVDKQKGEVISEIITTMGKSSLIGLGFKKNHLKALGKQLDGIGPLQFLGYIFSHEDLKLQMVNIKKSSMKWNGFIDGLKPGLNREAATKELYENLPGFATTLKVQLDPLKNLAENKDWDGFVAYLVDH